VLGRALENFVVTELRKQSSWGKTKPQLFHFRTQSGQEVDVVMEDAVERFVGVEVKESATVTGGDFKGLRASREMTGSRFTRGVLL
jgi:predicted AAA+ superfamily ATPase